jgi:hypothetical protein
VPRLPSCRRKTQIIDYSMAEPHGNTAIGKVHGWVLKEQWAEERRFVVARGNNNNRN